MHLRNIILLVFLLTCFTGCGRKDAWLRGKWTLDREFTEAQLAKQPAPKSGENSLMGDATAMLAPMLIGQMDGATFTFTGKTITFVTKDGSGQSFGYEVLEMPTSDSWMIKTSDGKVETYYREGDRLAIEASGSAHFKVYLKRVNE